MVACDEDAIKQASGTAAIAYGPMRSGRDLYRLCGRRLRLPIALAQAPTVVGVYHDGIAVGALVDCG